VCNLLRFREQSMRAEEFSKIDPHMLDIRTNDGLYYIITCANIVFKLTT
jgi:hypothetical protein